MKRKQTREVWLTLDEATDVSASLTHFGRCLSLTNSDLTAWKWAIITIHNALQGSMTCHLAGTANLGCLSKDSACKWLEWRERDRQGVISWIESKADEIGIANCRAASKQDQSPRQYLATAQVLFDRLHKEKLRVENGCGAILHITIDQRKSFKILNGLRNQFSHFTPMGWSIEVSGLPRIFNDMLTVIHNIVADPWPFRHLSESERENLDRLLIDLGKEIGARETV